MHLKFLQDSKSLKTVGPRVTNISMLLQIGFLECDLFRVILAGIPLPAMLLSH